MVNLVEGFSVIDVYAVNIIALDKVGKDERSVGQKLGGTTALISEPVLVFVEYAVTFEVLHQFISNNALKRFDNL